MHNITYNFYQVLILLQFIPWIHPSHVLVAIYKNKYQLSLTHNLQNYVYEGQMKSNMLMNKSIIFENQTFNILY